MTDTLQGTAFYSRKIQPVQYESAEASFFVQFEIDEIIEDGGFQTAMNKAKIATFEALGIDFIFDDHGNVREQLPVVAVTQEQAVANVERAFAPTPTPAPARQAAPSGNTAKVKVWSRIVYPDGRKNDRGEIAKVPNPSWLAAAAAEAGVTDVWDNRKDHPAFGGPAKTKNGKDARKLPYFKEKDGETAFWPPRDHADAAPNYVHPDFAGDPRSTPNDDEETF